VVCKEEGGGGVARDGSERRMRAVAPGETLGTLYNIRVGSNKTKQHDTHTHTMFHRSVGEWGGDPWGNPRYPIQHSRRF